MKSLSEVSEAEAKVLILQQRAELRKLNKVVERKARQIRRLRERLKALEGIAGCPKLLERGGTYYVPPTSNTNIQPLGGYAL